MLLASHSHYPTTKTVPLQDNFPSTHPIYQLPNHAVPGLGLRVACSIFPISYNGQFVPNPDMLRDFWCQIYTVALIAIISIHLHIIPLVHYIWSFLLTKSEVELAFRLTAQKTHKKIISLPSCRHFSLTHTFTFILLIRTNTYWNINMHFESCNSNVTNSQATKQTAAVRKASLNLKWFLGLWTVLFSGI